MSDRLQEIRARLDAAGKEAVRTEARVRRSGWGAATITYGTTDVAKRDFLKHAPADIAWLLDQVEDLTKRVRMYEVVKS